MMKSYQVDKLNQKCVSNVAGDHPRYGDDCMPITENKPSVGFHDPHITSEKGKMESYIVDPPEYSQVTSLDVRGPSHTSTPMARHTGVNVNPEREDEKIPIKEMEER